jgi:DNA polymerase III epsilon subunit-like protein
LIFVALHWKVRKSQQMTYTLFFDTETTGLPKNQEVDALKEKGNWPDLVSISWGLYKGYDCVKRASYIIRPDDWTIPEDSVRFHGITTEDALEKGVPLGEVLFEMRDDIKLSNRIVAHNMAFDKNVLFNAFAWRLGKDARKFWPTGADADFCSLQKSKYELKLPGKFPKSRDPYKFPGLDELYRATFEEDAPIGAHNAERDVRVLEKIVIARWPQLMI